MNTPRFIRRAALAAGLAFTSGCVNDGMQGSFNTAAPRTAPSPLSQNLDTGLQPRTAPTYRAPSSYIGSANDGALANQAAASLESFYRTSAGSSVRRLMIEAQYSRAADRDVKMQAGMFLEMLGSIRNRSFYQQPTRYKAEAIQCGILTTAQFLKAAKLDMSRYEQERANTDLGRLQQQNRVLQEQWGTRREPCITGAFPRILGRWL